METEPMTAAGVKVAIIEDDPVIREGYAYFINASDGFKVVGTYSSAEEALKKLPAAKPDIVLLDIGLPGMNGIEAISKIRQQAAQASILVLTVHESEDMIFGALTQGASGYLTKNCSPEKIISSINDVVNGGGSMSANVANLVIRSFRRNECSPLSKRETEILEQIAKGKSRSKIALELFIDAETVKSHLKNIYAKLNVHSKADAIRSAKESRLI